jgi:hypothetical protein
MTRITATYQTHQLYKAQGRHFCILRTCGSIMLSVWHLDQCSYLPLPQRPHINDTSAHASHSALPPTVAAAMLLLLLHLLPNCFYVRPTATATIQHPATSTPSPRQVALSSAEVISGSPRQRHQLHTDLWLQLLLYTHRPSKLRGRVTGRSMPGAGTSSACIVRRVDW